jgi:hypothetical protein
MNAKFACFLLIIFLSSVINDTLACYTSKPCTQTPVTTPTTTTTNGTTASTASTSSTTLTAITTTVNTTASTSGISSNVSNSAASTSKHIENQQHKQNFAGFRVVDMCPTYSHLVANNVIFTTSEVFALEDAVHELILGGCSSTEGTRCTGMQ